MPVTLDAFTHPDTLPHWETIPDDVPGAIREIKRALRARIVASGRTVEEVFAVIEARVRAQVEEVAGAKRRGESVWPVINYADVAAGTVTSEGSTTCTVEGALSCAGTSNASRP
jgi:hypothetical protein